MRFLLAPVLAAGCFALRKSALAPETPPLAPPAPKPSSNAAPGAAPPPAPPPFAVIPKAGKQRISGFYAGPKAARTGRKPTTPAVFVPYFFKFFKEEGPFESCHDVVEELSNVEGSDQLHMMLFNIIHLVDRTLDDNQLSADKDCKANAVELESHTTQLVDFMSRLMRCKIDESTGRGIIQKMLEAGMANCLETEFAYRLFYGEGDYIPGLTLDKEGNTLLHLAVMSPNDQVLKVLSNDLELRKNRELKRKMNHVFWILSALEFKNDAGLRPVDSCVCPSVRLRLKTMFRTYSLFMNLMEAAHRPS